MNNLPTQDQLAALRQDAEATQPDKTRFTAGTVVALFAYIDALSGLQQKTDKMLMQEINRRRDADRTRDELRDALRDAISVIEGLAEQQAMQDDWWIAEKNRLEFLLKS
jgi:septal ring factor EnvC (AmiA/AmiB activator)